MYAFFADPKIYHRDHEYDSEEDQCRSARAAVVSAGKRFVNESDYGVHAVGVVDRTEVFAEYTDYARIFLESSYEACDNNIGEHGGQKRNRDPCKYAESGGSVNLCSIIILTVDALKSAKQDKDLEGQGIPDNVDDHDHHIGKMKLED